MSHERIATLLREWIGLEPGALGESLVRSAVEREMARMGVDDTGAYCARLEQRGADAEALAARLLVHETFMFRYPASFEHLAAFARARRRAGRTPLRVLCVPCSTGEEAASIAITLADAGLTAEDVILDASDVSDAAVRTARAGWIAAGSFRGFDPRTRPDVLTRDGGGYRLSAGLRERIRYSVGNILEPVGDDRQARYDVVFCRNLLIYLTRQARTRVLARLTRRLDPDGHLYLGHAEVAACAEAGFVPLDPPSAFVCALGRTAPARPRSAPPRPRMRTPPPAPSARVPRPLVREAPTSTLDDARRLADRGELNAALASIQQDVDAGHRTADHYHLTAVIHRAAGRHDLADSALGRALYLEPGHYAALVQSALAADERGDAAAAERFRVRASRVDPKGEVRDR